MPDINILEETLRSAGLKVTPQRLAILEAMYSLPGHPTAEAVQAEIKGRYPGISTGTIYKVLETLVAKKLIKRVKTEAGTMRYDGVLHPHHHLYCDHSGRIEDYSDSDLDLLLEEHFRRKGIEGFRIEELTLQIKGQFEPNDNST